MKRIVLAGALMLGLVACGGDEAGGGGGGSGGGGGGTTGYPYNPDASETEATDTRVPYRGDWVWVAKLPDDSYQTGVLVVSFRGDEAPQAKNGGVGDNALCTDSNCTQINVATSGFGLISTQLPSSGPQLEALLADPADPDAARLVMVDTDGRVATEQGRAVLSGAGRWRGTQAARVALVQINADENTRGSIDAVVPAEVLTQAKAAADRVTAQQVQPFSSLDAASSVR